MLVSIMKLWRLGHYPRKVYERMLAIASKVNKKQMPPGMADTLDIVQGAGFERRLALLRRCG